MRSRRVYCGWTVLVSYVVVFLLLTGSLHTPSVYNYMAATPRDRHFDVVMVVDSGDTTSQLHHLTESIDSLRAQQGIGSILVSLRSPWL